MKLRTLLVAGIVTASGFFANASQAVDGCKVLLCLAGNWKNISQCVPPVEEALEESALGKPFPSCPSVSADQAGLKFGTISYLPCTDSYGPDAVDLGATHGFQAQHLCGVPAPCTSSTYVDNGGGRYVNAGEILILAGRGPAVGRPTCYKGVAAQLPPSHNYVDVYVNGQFYNRDYY